MNNNSTRHRAAFISFADTDRMLALELAKLLRYFNLEVYVAPESLPRAGQPDWKKEIIDEITRSYSFIPLYTANSLNRRWVMYELGIADCAGIKVFPAKVAGVSHDAIKQIPAQSDYFVYDLASLDNLTDLIINVSRECGGNLTDSRHIVENAIGTIREGRTLLAFAKTRWVFIAGSAPKSSKYQQLMRLEGHPRASMEEILNTVATDITMALLENGFYVSACPQVPNVGAAVEQAFRDWQSSKPEDSLQRFRMRGMYPPMQPRITKPDQRNQANAMIHEFRKSYLRDVEAVIVLGGNKGTQEEVEAANELRIRILSIPSIGGTGGKVWSEFEPNNKLPFDKEMTEWTRERADAVAQVLLDPDKLRVRD